MWYGVERGQWQWLVEQAVPHSRAADKNQEGQLESEQSQPQARPHSPGFQCQVNKASLPLAVKSSRGLGSRRNCQSLREFI